MKKTLWNTILILAFCPFLVQCASTSQGSPTDLRFRNLETRMTTLERDTKAINAQNQGQAEMGLTVDSIAAQMLQVKGHLEANNQQLRETQKTTKEGYTTLDQQTQQRIKENNASLKKQLEANLTAMQENMTKLAELLSSTMEDIDTIKKARSKEATERAMAAAQAAQEAMEQARQQQERAAAAAATKESAKASGMREISPAQTKKKMVPKETPTTAPKTKKSYGSQYEKGLALYRDHKYKEAYNTFLDYIDKEPKGEMIPNARFWVGDSLFKQREYELAILEYQKVIADYPKHGKAPAALLKQGLAFERLKDQETAKLVYKKLLDDFPNSEQAKTAKQWLEKH